MIGNTLLLALREIRRNLLRSFLTTLGIVIGVAAVVTMVTVGNGAPRAVQAQISSLGSNLLMIRPGQRLGPGQGAAGAPSFKLSDLQAIESQIGGIAAVAPEVRGAVTVVAEGKNWSTTVTGTSNAYFQTSNWVLASGRKFEEAEMSLGSPVCILGATVRKELFGAPSAGPPQAGAAPSGGGGPTDPAAGPLQGRVAPSGGGGSTVDPLGQAVRIKQFSCQVIGLLQSKGQGAMGIDQDDTILLPLATAQRRVTGSTRINTLLVSMKDDADTEALKSAITDLLRERRKLAAADDNNFNLLDTRQVAETLSGTTQLMTSLLGAVAAVSLLVGGIGIMNIMLVSVTERTREIGIRLAIGALEREVLLQFLIEAVALSSLGGLVGLLLATAASVGISAAMGVPYEFDVGINSLAFGFSAAIGVVFGYFPARRAARLDPIEALRHE